MKQTLGPGWLAMLLLVIAGPVKSEGEKPIPTFEGEWIGQYQTRQALHGQLEISISKSGEGYTATVISSNEHYPSKEPEEIQSFSVDDGEIRWVLYFGSTKVEWTGMLKGDFIVGELTGGGDHSRFQGYWTAVRSSAAVKPGRSR